MKTKLLKKVRKRFEIIHMPNGYVDYDGDHYNYNLFRLTDKTKPSIWDVFAELVPIDSKPRVPYTNNTFQTEEECISYLQGKMIKRLREEGFRQRKDYKIKQSEKKVWWKL